MKSEELHDELNRLFKFAPPQNLQRSLLHLFIHFVQQDKDDLPSQFKNISVDFFYLYTFLQKAEEILTLRSGQVPLREGS